jgi:hypothetical protein
MPRGSVVVFSSVCVTHPTVIIASILPRMCLVRSPDLYPDAISVGQVGMEPIIGYTAAWYMSLPKIRWELRTGLMTRALAYHTLNVLRCHSDL